MTPQLDRRRFLRSTASLAAAPILGATSAASAASWLERHASGASSQRRNDDASVVLYSSLDDVYIREIVKLAREATKLDVLLVGDTEATKTTGLVQRLIAERDNPKADVWWSSEAMGTIKLDKEGVLEAYSPEALQGLTPAWPDQFATPKWTGLACRARVIVFNTKRIEKQAVPNRLADLADPAWNGRIGLARPAFGTTRSQFAALLLMWGEDAYKAWLTALKANRVKLFDGNATVVRACAEGQIDVGLTDTDDVWAGQANGWPVDRVFEQTDTTPLPESKRPPVSFGALLMPTTLALVKGRPHADNGKKLIEFLLSPAIEEVLAKGEAKHAPVRPSLAGKYPDTAIPTPWMVGWEAVADSADRAVTLATEILGG